MGAAPDEETGRPARCPDRPHGPLDRLAARRRDEDLVRSPAELLQAAGPAEWFGSAVARIGEGRREIRDAGLRLALSGRRSRR